MSALVRFMSSTTGRIVRIVAGIVLIAVGLLAISGTAGIIVAIIGLLPLFAGTLDVCVLAPVFGMPLSGKQVRSN